jgi:glutamate--cysteine ligase
VRKFRIANALGPLLAFVTDNSPVFEGRPVGSGGTGPTGLAVPARMARTAIWDDVDAARSMVAPHTFDEGFGFHSYATSILQAPAIFTVEDDEAAQGGADGANGGGKHSAWQGMRPFTDALAGRALDRAAIEHVLSLFFFDVRFKTYIEIRMADSLPIDYALAFAALIKGLFYSEDNLQGIEGLLVRPGRPEALDGAAVALAKAALCEEGYNAVVYGRPATEWLDALVGMAQRALDDDERSYLKPLAKLVAARTTLIDEA